MLHHTVINKFLVIAVCLQQHLSLTILGKAKRVFGKSHCSVVTK